MTVGERLKLWREPLSQKAAALACGIKQQAWNRWEKDETEPGSDSIRKICLYFGKTADELLGIERGNSAAVVVHGSGNAVANGPHAQASLVIGNAGEAPLCKGCKYLKTIKKLQKAGLQLPD